MNKKPRKCYKSVDELHHAAYTYYVTQMAKCTCTWLELLISSMFFPCTDLHACSCFSVVHYIDKQQMYKVV